MSIKITRPWARIQTEESREAAGFMTLKNGGPHDDLLLDANSAAAETTEIYGIRVVKDKLRMRLYQNGLTIPVGMPIELKPRGYHLFMQGLKAPLLLGQKVPVTLTFEKAGTQHVELVVEAKGLIGKDTLGIYVPNGDKSSNDPNAREP